MDNDPTISDVLEAINNFATRVEGDIRDIKANQERIDSDVKYLKANMVTKSYLDDKLCDLHGEMGLALRKEDQKVDAVVNKLEEKQVFTSGEAKSISLMTPFST